MKPSVITILSVFLLISGCASDPYRRVYETIRNREDGFKSPAERAMTPTPNYGTYRNERDQLQHKQPATGKQIFTEHNKPVETHGDNALSDTKPQDLQEPQCMGSCVGTANTPQFNYMNVQ
jgi:hypothetical protein